MPPTVKVLDVRIFGTQRVQRKLFRSQLMVGDMRPALEEVADDLMWVIGSNFSSQGRRGGGSWQKLSDERIRQKTKKGTLQRGILVDTGALHDSMTQRGDQDQILKITRNSLSLGSKLPYADVHDEGKGRMPKRQFTKIMTGDRLRWVHICEQKIMEAFYSG